MKRPVLLIVIFLAVILYSDKIYSQELNQEPSQTSSSVPTSSPTEAEPVVPAEVPQVQAAPAATAVETPQIPEPEQQPQPQPLAPVVSEEKPKERKEDIEKPFLLIDEALPEGATSQGVWYWDSALKYSGERSHTEPAKKEVAEHSYRANSIEIPKNSVMEQYVYLDPNAIPKGIMLKFSVENGTSDAEIGVYWEGEEEVFVYNNDEPMLYYGVLPNAGKWERLEVYFQDLGLEGARLSGISFVVYGGKANWDFTKIRPIKEGEGYPQAEELPAEEIKDRGGIE